jgi:Holliday junction resolvase RusA-like endonuclease
VTITSVTIYVPELPPSPNRTRRETHWSKRAAINGAWRHEAAALAHQIDPPRWERVRLSALFFLPDRRRRDYPNLVGSEGMKGLIDGLVDAGVMVDDSITCLVEYGPFTYVYRKGKPGVSVTVEPLD